VQRQRPILKDHPIFAALLRTAASAAIIFLFVSASRRTDSGPEGGMAMPFTISTSAFSNGGSIAKQFTCDGPDVSPQLAWTEAPAATKSFALLVDDPDAPVGNWNHWTMWNLAATLHGLAEGVSKDARLSDGTEQGKNDFGKTGYNGPCPPAGKPHRYYFKLFALDTTLDLKAGSRKKDLEAAMKNHVLGQAEWMGTYGR
jgi:Raf kinase inhibitor-like YbhB/YbcL family protein